MGGAVSTVAALGNPSAGSGFALRSAVGPDGGSPGTVTTNTHVPVTAPGPAVKWM